VKPTLPPSYVNTPVAIAYADVDDALIVTMTRILGLCWAYDYERTPALTPEQVAELTSRPRSTIYRHLKHLREIQWIRVDQIGRRIIIRPITNHTGKPVKNETKNMPQPNEDSAPNEALREALADIGVENPKRSQLIGLNIDPLWVRAWHLWARHPHRQSLTNPVGNIILKLESREQPPGEFLRAAEEQIHLHEWMREQEELQGRGSEDNDASQPASDNVPAEARRIWADSLSELQLQMTRATFDTWLRGSQVVQADDGCLIIAVRHAYAVDWLQHRLLPVIQRTVTRHAGGDVEITFVAGT
jgi:hypothetical protein